MNGSHRFIDVSHEVVDAMAPYPGLPTPRIGAYRDHAASREHYDGEEFFVGMVEMPANVGTYIDAPFHRDPGAADLADIPLERLVGLPGLVIDATEAPSRLLDLPLPNGDLSGAAVLIRTGWDCRWATGAYWTPGPYLSERFAQRLADSGVGLLGVDFWNVDDTETRRRPVHTVLLRGGVLIVEHLCNLGDLPDKGFRFSAPVLRVRPGASFPVRAYVELEG